MVFAPRFNSVEDDVFSCIEPSISTDLFIFCGVVMPWRVGFVSRQSRAPCGITVFGYPVDIDLRDGDDRKPTITCWVFDAVIAVCGADDASGAIKGFDTSSVGLAHVILSS